MAKTSLNLPYLILSSSVIIAIVAIAIYARPIMNENLQLRRLIADKKQLLSDRQEFVRTIDRKKAELQVHAVREAELALELPADESIDDVLRLIGQFAEQTGVVVKTINNDSKSSLATYRAIVTRGEDTDLPAGVVPLQVRLSMNGSYAQTRSFLDRLERSPRLIDVDQFTMKATKGVPDSIDSELQAQLYMYELPSQL